MVPLSTGWPRRAAAPLTDSLPRRVLISAGHSPFTRYGARCGTCTATTPPARSPACFPRLDGTLVRRVRATAAGAAARVRPHDVGHTLSLRPPPPRQGPGANGAPPPPSALARSPACRPTAWPDELPATRPPPRQVEGSLHVLAKLKRKGAPRGVATGGPRPGFGHRGGGVRNNVPGPAPTRVQPISSGIASSSGTLAQLIDSLGSLQALADDCTKVQAAVQPNAPATQLPEARRRAA